VKKVIGKLHLIEISVIMFAIIIGLKPHFDEFHRRGINCFAGTLKSIPSCLQIIFSLSPVNDCMGEI
jgi:hypothetical protein